MCTRKIMNLYPHQNCLFTILGRDRRFTRDQIGNCSVQTSGKVQFSTYRPFLSTQQHIVKASAVQPSKGPDRLTLSKWVASPKAVFYACYNIYIHPNWLKDTISHNFDSVLRLTRQAVAYVSKRDSKPTYFLV